MLSPNSRVILVFLPLLRESRGEILSINIIYLFFFIYLLWCTGLNSGPQAWWASALPFQQCSRTFYDTTSERVHDHRLLQLKVSFSFKIHSIFSSLLFHFFYK
jgi:hypothetical protein